MEGSAIGLLTKQMTRPSLSSLKHPFEKRLGLGIIEMSHDHLWVVIEISKLRKDVTAISLNELILYTHPNYSFLCLKYLYNRNQ